MDVEVVARTDPGRDPQKQVNEDVVAHKGTAFGHLCVVCDGMGGHAGGREAAQLALATVFRIFDEAPAGGRGVDVLRHAVAMANGAVHSMPTTEVGHGRPGSTLVALLVHDDGTEVAHVGDSRGYLVHEGQIFQLTKDHSMVQKMVDAQLLTPAEAATHPEANKILRALGTAPAVEVEVRPQPVRHVEGDVLVLCSDGLSDLVEPEEIRRAVLGAPLTQAAGQLVELANARGGHDNITVLLARPRATSRQSATQVPPTAIMEALPTANGALPAGPVPGQGTPAAPARSTVPFAAVPPSPAAVSSPAAKQPSPSRTTVPVGLVAGIALAVVGLVAAAVLVYLLQQDRAGHAHHGPATLDLGEGGALLDGGDLELVPAAPSVAPESEDPSAPGAAPLAPMVPPLKAPLPLRPHGRDGGKP